MNLPEAKTQRKCLEKWSCLPPAAAILNNYPIIVDFGKDCEAGYNATIEAIFEALKTDFSQLLVTFLEKPSRTRCLCKVLMFGNQDDKFFRHTLFQRIMKKAVLKIWQPPRFFYSAEDVYHLKYFLIALKDYSKVDERHFEETSADSIFTDAIRVTNDFKHFATFKTKSIRRRNLKPAFYELYSDVMHLPLIGEFRGNEKNLSSLDDFFSVLDKAIGFTCISVVAVDCKAYDKFITALCGTTSTDCLQPSYNSEFIEKVFGAKYQSKGGYSSSWQAAGKFPLTHAVANKLITIAENSPLVIPVSVNAVIKSRLSGEHEHCSLYDLLTPFRVIVGYPDKSRTLPHALIVGIHDEGFNRYSAFERKAKEAISKNWPRMRLSIRFILEHQIKKYWDNEQEIKGLLSWSSNSTKDVIQTAKMELEKKVLTFYYRRQFVKGSELVEKPDSLENSLEYLVKRHFITAPKCQLTHGMHDAENLDVFCLIDGRWIEDVLLEIRDHSEVARKAFTQHGLIPGEVIIDALKSYGKNDETIPILRHYGIFILPTEIKCRHDLAPVNVGPRENFNRPISLPEPAERAYIIPHLLRNKPLPTNDPPNYLRTEAFVIRHEDGHRISEGLFYFLAAIFIKHYPKAPRCYHRATRLRVEKGHILEIRLQDDVLLASMLVQTSDETFQETDTAKVCSHVKRILMEDAKMLSISYLAKRLQFGAMMKTHDFLPDFVDLETQSFTKSSGPFYSEEGEEFIPSSSLYLWYGSYGPEGSLLEKHFAKLAEEMRAKEVLDYLISKEQITGEEYRTVVVDSNLHCSKLLLMLGRRKRNCDELLYDALFSTNQFELARFMNKEDSGANATQAVPTEPSGGEYKKTVVTQPVQQDESELPNVSLTGLTENVRLASSTGPLARSSAIEGPTSSQRTLLRQTPSVSTPPPISTSTLSDSTVKGDPTVHPVFEAKYYHVERSSDHFNERPFREGGKRLGAGSFGTVYHGVLHSEDGQKFEVAIKRLKKASSLNPAQIELSKKQFGVELNMLTRYVHDNVISLVGFSSNGPELCLIFEYMANGALSHRLDCRDNTPPLPWTTRLSVSVDIACGLDFLHTKYRLPVIHRDVKSSNILLSATFKAKLSDFGLAVTGSETEETTTGVTVGTRPYMAPESFQKILTTKLDVYGFGMIMYELATGLPPYSSKKKQDLKSYVDDIESQGIDLMKMLDPKAKWPKSQGREESQGLKLLKIAKKCTVKEYTNRVQVQDILPSLRQLADRK